MIEPRKIGQLIGPNAVVRVETRIGFEIELRLLGRRIYMPIHEEGIYEAGIEDLGFAPPSDAFPIEFFEVESSQALLNMIFWKHSKKTFDAMWADVRPKFQNSVEEVIEAIRPHLRSMLIDAAVPVTRGNLRDAEFLERRPAAVDFVLDNFFAQKLRKGPEI